MSFFYALRRRWREGKVERLERYIRDYRKRRARLDRKQLEATTEYEALKAFLDGQPERGHIIRAGGLRQVPRR